MVSYEPLFKTLDRLNITLFKMEKDIGLSSSITAKFRKNENVSLETIVKICIYLDVPIEDVVEIVRK